MKRLSDNISSAYFTAANRMAPRSARRRIVAYVESYDDVFFWRTALSRFEDKTRYFEVMLPSKGQLQRGKKAAMMSAVADGTGSDMIACVDADYDYLIEGATDTSRRIRESPYIFHTYVYAIENYQCYAPSLHNVCVMVALNDHAIFDFDDYLARYSEACWPLLVWSVWAYRQGVHSQFPLTDFLRVIDPGGFSLAQPGKSIDNLRRKVQRRCAALRHQFPDARGSWLAMREAMQAMGCTPQTAYLYIQGHHIADNVVVPIITKVCARLRQEREREICGTAAHRTQMRGELSCYENSIEDVRSMLRKNMGYVVSEPFLRLQDDISRFLAGNNQPDKPDKPDKSD